MKLANILTPTWMRSRKTDELVSLHLKLANALDKVLDDIQASGDEELADLRDDRAHLGQVVEDLERTLDARAARPIAA